jgi:hypothetical protein
MIKHGVTCFFLEWTFLYLSLTVAHLSHAKVINPFFGIGSRDIIDGLRSSKITERHRCPRQRNFFERLRDTVQYQDNVALAIQMAKKRLEALSTCSARPIDEFSNLPSRTYGVKQDCSFCGNWKDRPKV